MLVTTVVVRVEADVIAATIEHRLAQGIDRIVVTDDGSVDDERDVSLSWANQRIVQPEEASGRGRRGRDAFERVAALERLPAVRASRTAARIVRRR